MSTMISQILKCVDFTKTEKSIHLRNETIIFPQIKKLITYIIHQGLLEGKK